jgi:riboflavin biosynthesis pyrimidine reductase
LPLDIPLFAESEMEVIVFSATEIDTGDTAAQLEIITLPADQLTFAAAFAHLLKRYGVRALLCEGGPRVFGALADEGVADQLFLTLARRFVGGGDAPAIASGAELMRPLTMDLEGVLERAGSLFLRYSIAS